jgi:peptidoglycan/xylan/chitin deacetylase (PgdA/CDA1 family)
MAASIVLVAILLGLLYYLFMSETSQVLGKFPYKLETSEKIVALTFDDGPNPPYTDDLLEVLKKHDVKATFFMVGKNVEKFAESARSVVSLGHTVGNHSYSHKFSKYFMQPSFADEIAQTQTTFSKILGLTPQLFRPPWLVRHRSLLTSAQKLGLRTFGGVFASELEVFQISAAKIADRAYAKTKPGTILIFHDGFDAKGGNRSQTVAAVDMLITKLKNNGYTFVTLT